MRCNWMLGLVIVVAHNVLAFDFFEAMELAKNGEYEQAYVIWWPLAHMDDPDAQHNLGVMYEWGLGVEKDLQTAVRWYKRAAAHNHPDAQNNLGTLYVLGQGVSKNLQQAQFWFEKAAKQNHFKARDNLRRTLIMLE